MLVWNLRKLNRPPTIRCVLEVELIDICGSGVPAKAIGGISVPKHLARLELLQRVHRTSNTCPWESERGDLVYGNPRDYDLITGSGVYEARAVLLIIGVCILAKGNAMGNAAG